MIGADGMLGRAWRRLLNDRGRACTAVNRDTCDLSRDADVEATVDGSHCLVINCAAYSNVDEAESETQAAQLINGAAVGTLGRRCAAVGALLVHYSTDYVFNGRSTTPWRVDQPTDPINAYGRTKAMGEQLLRDSDCRFLLLRTSWLYAPWGSNFVLTIAALAGQATQPLRVVHDQTGRPTSAEHLAKTSLQLIEDGHTGTWHVTDGGACTWYEMARRVVQHVNPNSAVEPCTTQQFPRPAPRPPYSVLDITETEAVVGPMPHWKQNLSDVLKRIEPST